MGILNCWWAAHRSFFSHRSFSEDGSGGGRHPDARSLAHAIGAACLPVGRGYTLQAPSFKFWQFIPSAASGGFPLLSLAD